jgi:hypothetical protein
MIVNFDPIAFGAGYFFGVVTVVLAILLLLIVAPGG